jgi:hypothetical protein
VCGPHRETYLLLIDASVDPAASLPDSIAHKVYQHLLRIDPLLAMRERRSGTQGNGDVASAVPIDATARERPVSVETLSGGAEAPLVGIATFDDAGAPVPSLLDVPFAASKMRPLAAKEAGANSVVVAVYVYDKLSTETRLVRAPWAACFRAAPQWPIGKFLDVIVAAVTPPLDLSRGGEQLVVVHLKKLIRVENGAKCGDTLVNGDAITLVRGGVLPLSVATQAASLVELEKAGQLPPPVRAKALKDCVVA